MTSARPAHQELAPSLDALWSLPAAGPAAAGAAAAAPSSPSSASCAFLAKASLPADAHERYGAPALVWTAVNVTAVRGGGDDAAGGGVRVAFDVQWFNKTATRLAEASWVSFAPALGGDGTGGDGGRWSLRSLGADVDPADVVAHGATHLHSLGPLSEVRRCGRACDYPPPSRSAAHGASSECIGVAEVAARVAR